MVKNIIPYCDGESLHYNLITIGCELLQMMISDYHEITLSVLPFIKLNIKPLKRITSSLLNRSSDIKLTYHYITSGKFNEEFKLVNYHRCSKLQRVAPTIVG